MARATLVKTAKSRKRSQPVCTRCGKAIEPGEMRYTWSFRYGGTYHQHAEHGAPLPSQLTQGRVGELYAEQEAIDDVTGNPPDEVTEESVEGFREAIADQLESAASVARDLGAEYESAAEAFGGAGDNQDRYEACEAWADTLESAAEDVRAVEWTMPDLDDYPVENYDGDQEQQGEAFAEAQQTVLDDAMTEMIEPATSASGELEL